MRQVVVDAIHGGLPSFLQSAGFLQSDRLLIRKWEKLDEPLVPLFLGDDVEASVLHTSHQIGGSGLFIISFILDSLFQKARKSEERVMKSEEKQGNGDGNLHICLFFCTFASDLKARASDVFKGRVERQANYGVERQANYGASDMPLNPKIKRCIYE